MNSTISLEQSVIKEVATLFGNEDALRQVLALAKKLKRVRKESATETECAGKAEIMDDLREGLREVRLAQKGKRNLQTWEEFKHELHC